MAQALEADEDYRVLRRFTSKVIYQEDSAVPRERLGTGIILDTETTGKDPSVDQIVELCMVRFTFDRETGTPCEIKTVLSALEDPGRPMDPAASRVSGITDEMVRGKRIDDALVFECARDSEVVIAHSSSFDREVAERRFKVFESLPWGCSYSQVDWESEGITGRKLDYLAFKLGFFYDAHRAENDCLALLEILSRPLPVSGTTGLKQILSTYGQQELRLWATGAAYEYKGVLAARKYRWADGTQKQEKAWHLTLPEERLSEELAWLKANVYRGVGRVVVDTVDAHCRFTKRRLGTRAITI